MSICPTNAGVISALYLLLAEGIIDDQDDVNGEQRSKSSSPEDPPSNNSTSRGTLGAAVSVDRASSPRFMRKVGDTLW